MAFWFKTNGPHRMLMKNCNGPACVGGFRIKIQKESKLNILVYVLYNETDGGIYVLTKEITLDTWKHVAITWMTQNATMAVYLDGVDVGALNYRPDWKIGSDKHGFIVGTTSYINETHPYQVDTEVGIDEWNIWWRCFSPIEVKKLFEFY